MYCDKTEIITYSSAEELANIYRVQVARLRESLATVHDATGIMKDSFGDPYAFGIGVTHTSQRYLGNEWDVENIINKLKVDAWKAIIARLNIRRLMSSKRNKELDEAFSKHEHNKFPEINAESIVDVVNGYVASANEFLEEAVAEEYDFWRPSFDQRNDYKRNSFFKLNKKIVKTWMVEENYHGGFRFNYSNQHHATALDNIMHMLDGNGNVAEYKGELVSSVEGTNENHGKTKYFKWRAFKNRNLHLEFRREDLLERFNCIAAKNRLGSSK